MTVKGKRGCRTERVMEGCRIEKGNGGICSRTEKGNGGIQDIEGWRCGARHRKGTKGCNTEKGTEGVAEEKKGRRVQDRGGRGDACQRREIGGCTALKGEEGFYALSFVQAALSRSALAIAAAARAPPPISLSPAANTLARAPAAADR
jgi:hypothetical protein